jgi:hypothetical protein
MRIGLTILFVALLASPYLFRQQLRARDSASDSDPSAVMARYGFHLVEISKKAGIDFVHRAPVLDPKLEHIMPQVASMGAAVSVVDFDRDGWPDIYVTNSATDSLNALYRNNHDGTFAEVGQAMSIADVNRSGTGVSMSAVWGDYDNDGYEDLFLAKWGRPELFHNEAGRGFRKVSVEAGLPAWLNTNAAIWLDFDGDGLLDLFVAGYYPSEIDLWHLSSTKMMPDSFEYATNGGRKYLFRNLGSGRFEEVAEKVGLKNKRWTLAAAAVDLRGTGRPDLFVANDYGVSELFINDGGRFREVSKESGIGAAPKSGMNASVGDVLNEGRFAFYVSNISEDGILIQGNNLWMPISTNPALPKYENLAGSFGVELGGWSFGAQFGDLNNDGTMDLYVTNGYISLDKSRSYWYDYSKVAGGSSTIIHDAKNWPAFNGRSLAGFQPKRVWVNDGRGRFSEVAQSVGVTDRYDGRAVALADFWNRGVLDAVVANQSGPLLLYKNTTDAARNWIGFDLEGSRSNRSAIGAVVTVYWNGQKQAQTISGGVGFAAQNDRRLHFGLGSETRIDRIEIGWPSGQKQTIAQPQIRMVHKIREPV